MGRTRNAVCQKWYRRSESSASAKNHISKIKVGNLATPHKSFLHIFQFARADFFLLKGKENFWGSALNEQGGGA